jgi:hypothetical protein
MAKDRPAAVKSPGSISLDGGPTTILSIDNLSDCPSCGGTIVAGYRDREDTLLYWCLNPACAWGPSPYPPGVSACS